MSGPTGHLTLVAPPPAPPEPLDSPGPIPPDALAAVDDAAEIAAQLAARDRELHFTSAGVQLRRLDGTVLRRLSPSEAMDVMCGLADVE
jgi:hypothetical protein